jgi:hypothetical protein
MIANPRFDAGRFSTPADDAVGVLLEEGIGCELATLAAGGTEEIGFMTRFAPRFTLTRIRSSTSPGRLSRGQLGCESRLPERPKGTGWQWFTCPGVDAGQVDMLPGLRRDVWQQMVRDITPA